MPPAIRIVEEGEHFRGKLQFVANFALPNHFEIAYAPDLTVSSHRAQPYLVPSIVFVQRVLGECGSSVLSFEARVPKTAVNLDGQRFVVHRSMRGNVAVDGDSGHFDFSSSAVEVFRFDDVDVSRSAEPFEILLSNLRLLYSSFARPISIGRDDDSLVRPFEFRQKTVPKISFI